MKKVRDKISRIVKIALSLVITFSTLQIMYQSHEVEAATSKASMMLWNNDTKAHLNPPAYTTSKAWEGSKLYWGNDGGNPLLWRILNTNDSMFASNSVLIQGEDSLGATSFGSNNTYMGSTLAGVIDAKYSLTTSSQERSATLTSARAEIYQVPGRSYKHTDAFSGKRWFAPTGRMLLTPTYGYPNNDNADSTRKVVNSYWLATAYGSSDEAPYYAHPSGELLINRTCTFSQEAYAASSLNPDSILLVSNADGGKLITVSNALTDVSAASGKYKFTVKDANQAVIVNSATFDSATNLATINYAKAGPGTSVSAMVTDNSGENIISYGRIASVATGSQTNQTATVTLPTNFHADGYKLKVFTEIANGDKQTDYASELVDVTVVELKHDVTVNYREATGAEQTKEFKNLTAGTDLTQNAEFIAIKNIAPVGYRKVSPFWTFTDSAAEADFSNVQKSFTASGQYVKTYDVLFTYRKADHSMVTGEKITVDTGTSLVAPTSKLPTLPTSYADKSGVTYRFDDKTNPWKVSTGSGTITSVTSDLTVEAATKKQLKTTIEYRNPTSPETWISNPYWIDEGGSVTGNIPGGSIPYLPTLAKQLTGYRLTQQNGVVVDIWKSSNVGNALENITQPSTIKPEYTKTYEVGFTYRKADHSMLTNGEKIIVDTGTDITSKLPSLPTYNPLVGVNYRLTDPATPWKSTGSGTITSVTSDLLVTAATTKQLETTIKYRDESTGVFTQNKYWIDTGTGILGNIPSTTTPYLPTLQKYIPGYRLTQQNGVVKDIWKVAGVSTNLSSITAPLTIEPEYTKTYEVAFTYRKADHSMVTNGEKKIVDAETNLKTVSNVVPVLPTSYNPVDGVNYQFNTVSDKWTKSTGSGTIESVSDNLLVEAKTTKQLETTITYRDPATPETWILKPYWIDDGTSILGNIPGTSNPYLPILQNQIKGYRLKETSGDKTKIWGSSNAGNALGSITQPSTIEPDYVKNWEVLFKTWDDKAWAESPWKDGPSYIDNGDALKADQIPNPPHRPFYNFMSWNEGLTSITKDTTIQPLYTKQNFEIRGAKELDVLSTSEATTKFTGLEENAIKAALQAIYNPTVYSGGVQYPDQTGLLVATKNPGDYAKLKAGEVGKYNIALTYTNPSDATFTAQHEVVLRITNAVQEESAKKGKLAANDFTLGTQEIGTVDEMFYATYAGAFAFNKANQAQLVTVKDASAIKKEPGVYPVTFTTTLDGVAVSATVQVTVKDSAKGQEHSTEVKERIAANDIVLNITEVGTVKGDPTKLMELAQVSASNITTGEKITTITVQDNANIGTKRGSYPIRFKTDNGTATTSNVYVRDNSDIGTSYQISANDFTMSLSQVKEADEEVLKASGNAKATSKTTGEYGIIIVDSSALEAKKGVYGITYTAPDGTAITVQASVVDTVDEKGTERISASDFSLAPSDANKPNDATLIAAANAKAIDSLTGGDISITSVDKSQLKGVKGKYPVTFATSKGAKVTVNANVADNVKEENGLHIEGNSFSISKEEIKTINDSGKVVKLSGAKAYVISGGASLNVTATGMEDMQEEAGKYPLTLTATHQGTNIDITIEALVCDVSNENTSVSERITGNHFTISKEEVGTLQESELIARGSVEASDTNTGEEIAVKINNKEILKAQKGMYPLTFSTNKNTSIIVNVKVVDKASETGTTRISGNNFTMSLSDSSDDETIMDAFLIAKGNVKAVDSTTGNSVVVVVKDKTSLKKEPGEYTVTYTSLSTAINNTAEMTLTVRVVENGTSDVTTKESISANDIYVTTKDVKNLSKERLIAMSGVTAIQEETGKEMPILTAIHTAVAKRGEYTATFATGAGTALVVKVFVLESGETDETKNESISANAFKITIEEIKEAKKDGTLATLLKEKANVRAVDLSTGNIVDVTVDTTTLAEKKGSYEVTFKTAKQTSSTVAAVVVDAGTTNPDETKKEAIYANDFSLSIEESKTITNDALIKKANAKAENTVTGEAVVVSVKESKLEDKAGVYAITFTTVQDTSTTVLATVQKAGTSDATNKESIHANDFYLSKAEAANPSDALLIARANVQAVDEKGYVVDIKTVEQEIKETKGSYEVTFKTAKGTSVLVKAFVSDEVQEDSTGKEIITANDFYISVEEVGSAQEERFIELAKAKAYETKSGKELVVTVQDKIAIQAKKGSYAIEFVTDGGTSIRVQAHVMDKGATNPNPEIKEAIYANDFAVKAKEVTGLDEGKVKALSGARAIDLEDGTSVGVDKVDYSAIQATRGNYQVILETTKGTKVIVQATVQQNSVINEPDQEEMYSNDFTMSVEAADALLKDSTIDAKLMTYAKASANVLDTTTPIIVEVKEHTLQAAQGVYSVTFETVTGNTEITSKITVTGKGEEDPANQERIAANDFTIQVKEVEGVTKAKLIALAKAEAMDTSTGDLLEMKVDSQLVAKKGIYKVTFATEKGTSVTVQATVIENGADGNTDPNIEHHIYANDFSISVEDAKSVTSAEVLKLANAKAYEKASGAPVVVTVKDLDVIQNQPQGRYEVTYTTGKASITVYGTVTKSGGSGEVENPEDPGGAMYHERISANDFTIKVEEVATVTNEKIIAMAKAKAIIEETGAELEIVVDSKLEAKKGIYKVTFATEAGTSVTVQATVIENGADGNTDPKIEHHIYANDFSISVEDAKNVTSAEVLKLANAKAYEKASGAPVVVTVADLDVINNKPQGRYKVTYTTGKASITVYGTVTKSGGSGEVENPEDPGGAMYHERISANDFTIKVEEVATVTNEKIIAMAKAKAIIEETGAELEIHVDSKLEAKKGIYKVTFATEAGTSVTVQATVIENGADGNTDPAIEHHIYANDFSISVEDAKSVTSEEVLKLANAKAYEKASGAPVVVTVEDLDVIKNQPQGRYKVTYTTGKASITVYGTVTKSGGSGEVENPEDPTGPVYHERISANDFTIKVEEVATVTNEKIIAMAKAKAIIEETGAELEIHVDSKLEAKKGMYKVTFKTEAGTSVTVQATVSESGVENPDPKIKESIYASDFSISVEEAAKATEIMIKEKAKAVAFDDHSGASIQVYGDVNSVKGKPQGTYDVTFKTKNNTTIHVRATVTGKGGATNPDPDSKEAIYASDFAIAQDKVKGLKEADIIVLAKARAVDTQTGADITISKVTSQIKAETGIYEVAFETTKGTKVTVQATVTNAQQENPDPSITEQIYANRITVDVEQVKTMSNEDILTLSKARGVNTKTGASVAVHVIKNGVQAVEGMYQVRIGTVNNTVMDIQVTVTKKGNENPNPMIKEKIFANDFTIGVKDAANVSEERLIALAKARAVNTEMGSNVEVKVKANTIKGKNVGTYEVTFITENKTSITIKGTVQEKGIIDDANGEVITAQDFTISAKEAKAMSDKEIIELAKAKATDVSTGGEMVLKVQGKLGTSGEYGIVFVTEKGTKLAITVTVIPEDVPVISPEEPSLPGDSDGSGGNGNNGNTGGNGGSGNGGNGGNIENPTEDGSMEEGGAIIKPGDNGEKPTRNPDGTITIPKGGSVTVGDKEFVFKNGGTLNKDGTMDVGVGSTVIIDGKEVYFKYGGKINKDGTYTMSIGNSEKEAKNKTEGFTLKDTILPTWMLIYAGGYVWIKRKQEES